MSHEAKLPDQVLHPEQLAQRYVHAVRRTWRLELLLASTDIREEFLQQKIQKIIRLSKTAVSKTYASLLAEDKELAKKTHEYVVDQCSRFE